MGSVPNTHTAETPDYPLESKFPIAGFVDDVIVIVIQGAE